MSEPASPASPASESGRPGTRGFALRIALADLYYWTFGIATAPFWIWKLLTSSRYREGFLRRFGFFVAPRVGNRPCIWIHGVSVGEVLAARDLVKRLRRERPDVEIVFTVTTRTGFAIARQTYPDHAVTYFPMDLGFAVRRVFRALRPDLLVLVELELWPNVLLTAHRLGVPVAVVNGRITKRSFEGYRLVRWALAPALRPLAAVLVQTAAYGERLAALGVPRDRLRVTGNLKYDAVDPVAAAAREPEMRRRLHVADGEPVLVAGSVHPGEAEQVLAAWNGLRRKVPTLRLVLVPRHPEKLDEIERAIRAAGATAVRLTALDKGAQDGAAAKSSVILGDTMGELTAVYTVARAVFVGGSLVPVGGHNVLEPASLGKPVVVGPHTFSFKEPVALLRDAGGLRECDGAVALEVALSAWLADPAAAAEAGRRAKAAVEAERGATARTWDALAERFASVFGRRDTSAADGSR